MSSEESYLDVSLRKIAKGAGISFIGTAIGMFFGFITRIIIAKWLGPSDYGLISLGFAAMSIAATLSLFGMGAGIKRYVPFYKGKGDVGRIKGTILASLKISFPLSVIFAFLLFWYADWISVHFFHELDLTPVLRIFSFAIPFLVLSDNFISVTIGFQDMKYVVYVRDIFQNLFKLGAIVILLVLGFGVLGVAWGWSLSIVLMPFLAFYFLEKKVFPILKTKIKAIPVEKELFSFSWPLIFTATAGLVMGWVDTIMLGYFLTAPVVGIYNAALPTARLLKVALGSFGVIFMPVVSELYARNKIEDLKNTYSSVTKWIVSIVLPGFLLMAFFSKSIIRIMFGGEYIEGCVALTILAFGFFVYCVLGPTTSVLQTYGKTKIIMICYFVAASANFALNLLLIPKYGINGAATATAFSFVLMGVLNLLFIYRIGKMQPFRLSHFKSVFASITAILVIYTLTKYLTVVSLFVLVSMFFVFWGLYFFLLLLFKSFEEEDLMIMRAIDEKLGTKTSWMRKVLRRFL